ncbi:MAG: hypothetical protein JOZ53_16070 [Planctomycetaceae bacterium]|nr:hypothetical protein [Planctomycetaceae bacterium]
MANSISSFYQTVVAAATEASQLLAPTWKASDSIFWDYRPEPATIGQTLNVPIPQDPTGAVSDGGAGDLAVTDIGFTTVGIVFNKHPYFAYVVRDFEQFNSPLQVRTVFLDAALKGVKSNINGNVTALFTPGNFPTNAAIATTGHLVTTAQFLGAMAVLADLKFQVTATPENMSLLLPSLPYTAMLGDGLWTQAQIAGMKTAEFVRETGTLPTAYGMTAKLDQQMPVAGASPTRTFTAAYLHRWAVAGVTRPLPPPDAKVVDYTYIDFMGVPVRITVGYNQYPKQGYIVTVDAGYGLKVVRDNMGQLFTIAE